MRPLLRLAAITLVSSLAATPAHAGLLALDFQGFADPGSYLNGTPIGGTNFNVQLDFDPTTGTILGQGVASYEVTSIAVTLRRHVLLGGRPERLHYLFDRRYEPILPRNLQPFVL